MNLKLKWILSSLNSFVLFPVLTIQACSQNVPIESLFNKVKLVDLLCETCALKEDKGYSFFECRDGKNKIVFLSSIMGGFEYLTEVTVELSNELLNVCKDTFYFSNGLRIGMSKDDMLSLPIPFYAKENETYIYEEDNNDVSEKNGKKFTFTKSVIIKVTLDDDTVKNVDYSVIESDPEFLETDK